MLESSMKMLPDFYHLRVLLIHYYKQHQRGIMLQMDIVNHTMNKS